MDDNGGTTLGPTRGPTGEGAFMPATDVFLTQGESRLKACVWIFIR